MAASQAPRPEFSLVGFFRYFIFAHGQRSSHDRPLARVATIDGEVKILSFHLHPFGNEAAGDKLGIDAPRCLVTIALSAHPKVNTQCPKSLLLGGLQ
jgi:hypothetical protein